MPVISLGNVSVIRFNEQSGTPSTPAAGYSGIYMKSDGLYTIDDAGLVTGPITTSATIILAPATSVRNIILPTAGDYIPLTLRGYASAQTSSLFEIKEGSAGTIVHSMSGTGGVLFQNFTDSTTGFQIFDKDGGTPIFNVDTTNERVGVGTVAPSVAFDLVGSAKILPPTDIVPITIVGHSSATAKIIVAQEGTAATEVFSLSGTGKAIFQNFTDSTTGFQIFDKDGGTPIFNVDTTNEFIGIGTDSPTASLHISEENTNSSPHSGIKIIELWNPSVSPSGQSVGLNIDSEKIGTSAAGTGTIKGIDVYVANAGTNNVGSIVGASLWTDNSAGGTTTSMIALDIANGANSGGGTITDVYGIKIADVDAGASNYSILTNAGFIVFNEGGHAESDIRIETDNEDHFVFVDTGADWMRIGDWDTNYTHFAVDGTQTMVGTAKVKKIMQLPVAGTGGGASAPTFTNTFAPFGGWSMGIGDDLHYSFEIPYDCDTTEDITFNIHWYIDRAFADESGEVNWQIVYRAVTEDGTEPVDSGGSTATITSGDINIPGTAKSYLETIVGTIVAANISADDTIGIDLSRIALIGGVDPGGAKVPIVSMVHIEYISNKLGE